MANSTTPNLHEFPGDSRQLSKASICRDIRRAVRSQIECEATLACSDPPHVASRKASMIEGAHDHPFRLDYEHGPIAGPMTQCEGSLTLQQHQLSRLSASVPMIVGGAAIGLLRLYLALGDRQGRSDRLSAEAGETSSTITRSTHARGACPPRFAFSSTHWSDSS